MDSVALWFEEENENVERVTRRILRDRSDILSLNDQSFIQNFRLSKDAFTYVLNAIQHDLIVPKRSTAISNAIKVAATLKLLGQGGHQHQIGQDHLLGLSQQSMSSCLKEVCTVIERILCPKHIQFEVTPEEENEIKRGFFHACGIPGVIGAVDGTHIQMIRPARNEHLYFNRKLKHSMNAMVVAFRFITLSISKSSVLCVICGAEPSLRSLHDIAENTFRGELSMLQNMEKSIPQDLPEHIKIDSGIVAVIIANNVTRKYVFSSNMRHSTSTSRYLGEYYDVNLLRKIFDEIISNAAFLTNNLSTTNHVFEVSSQFCALDTHKCFTQFDINNNIICLLYISSIPMHTMKCVGKKLFDQITQEKSLCW